MEIDLEDNRIPNNKANVFKNQFRDWSISSAVIGSQLIAYFPHGEISQEWNSFVNLTDEFYSITAPGQKQRYPNIKQIQEIISSDPNVRDLDVMGLIRQNIDRYSNAKQTMLQYLTTHSKGKDT